MQVQLTGGARGDIMRILRRSETEFGEIVRGRYKRLLDQAITDIADDATRIGIYSIDDLRPGYSVYHLKWAKARTAQPTVRHPRHLLVFQISEEAIILAAVVHERELLERHLKSCTAPR